MSLIDQHIKVLSHHQVAHNTFLLGLRSSEITGRAKPGQFVMVRVRPDLDPLLRRPFSICAVQGDGRFFILYRVVGKGTALLSRTREGESLSVLGPLGNGFELPEEDEKAILVGGGIGVAPLVFLAQQLGGNGVWFLTGYRSRDEKIENFPEGLESLQGAEVATDDGSLGFKGFVTDLLRERLKEQEGNQIRLYACGPSPMLKQVVSLIQEGNFPCQVSLEANMACGLGACQGCAVRAAPGKDRAYLHVCQDGPVFSAEQIDWTSL